MNPFGDDEIDRADTDILDKVKAVCPNCGHIQYGCRPKIVVGDYD